MSDAPPASGFDDQAIVDLVSVARRVVGARIRDPHVVEDLVQETLTRVMKAHSREAVETLAPYAAVTARNLVASYAQRNDRARDRAHLLIEEDVAELPGDDLLRQEERSVVGAALARLPSAERDMLVAHEVDGKDTKTLAASRGSTPGAVAAQLSRARAKLRVEYLLAREQTEPPSDRCRPILRALSSGDRRRQRELDSSGHLLTCDCCTRLSASLLDRRPAATGEGGDRVAVATDADVVTARQQGRAAAAAVGFSATDLTLIATAISEIARNIVRFAERGEILIVLVSENDRQGVTVVARDVGPGIPDVSRAQLDGYSTYRGMGLGLPGSRRLMDQFEIVSEVGKGTTVTMTKWR